jgi:hypothetical protein
MLCLPTLQAEDTDTISLLKRSPFIGAGSITENAPAAQESNFELRGYYKIGDVYRFNIFDKNKDVGTWYVLEDRSGEIFLSDFNESEGTIVVHANGTTTLLKLAKPSELSAAPQIAAANTPGNNRRNVGTAEDRLNRMRLARKRFAEQQQKLGKPGSQQRNAPSLPPEIANFVPPAPPNMSSIKLPPGIPAPPIDQPIPSFPVGLNAASSSGVSSSAASSTYSSSKSSNSKASSSSSSLLGPPDFIPGGMPTGLPPTGTP